jgi:hypothetical protein
MFYLSLSMFYKLQYILAFSSTVIGFSRDAYAYHASFLLIPIFFSFFLVAAHRLLPEKIVNSLEKFIRIGQKNDVTCRDTYTVRIKPRTCTKYFDERFKLLRRIPIEILKSQRYKQWQCCRYRKT